MSGNLTARCVMNFEIFARPALKVSALMVLMILVTSEPAHAGGVGGALINAVQALINGALGAISAQVQGAINNLFALIFGPAGCVGATQTIGTILCNVLISTNTLPGFIYALSYLIGIVLAVTGLIKLKDHVLNPSQTPLSDFVKRMIAGGALFALPRVMQAAQVLITGDKGSGLTATKYAGKTSGGGGLDTMMAALIQDISVPLMNVLNGFGYLAGIVLTVIGIMRLLNTAQQGPRGPAGTGTIMTFVVAGLLFSTGTLVEAFSGSFFGTGTVKTFAILQTSSGDAAVDTHLLAVISTVLMFMTLVGWISVIRGMFILRDVAEGNGQASLMAAVTHMIGGSLAVNLGPLMNAVQNTFGLSAFGVVFS